MSFSSPVWWPAAAAACALVIFAGGCDVPTGEPSLNTDTELNTPLVNEKTFTFLGGPESEFEPLIDTTSSEFESLFDVGTDSKDISVVQKIDNFDVGTLDGALDNAAGDLAFSSNNFGETFIDLSEFTPPSFSNQRIGDVVPDPEEDLRVSTSGTIDVSGSDRVAFKQSNGDFVELGDTRVLVQDVTLRPTANERVFDSLSYSYPDVRLEPYESKDSLVVEFVRNPCGQDPCEGSNGVFQRDIENLESGFNIPLENARVYPDKPKITESGEATFRIQGGINPDLLVDDEDVVSLEISSSIENFEIQRLDVSKTSPFTVEVTPDADGSGGIDVADDEEARVAAFDGFEGLSSRVDGLELDNVSLDFSVATKNLSSTKAQLYTAIQGKNETEDIYLAGQSGTNRAVSSTDLAPFETEIVNRSSPVPEESLSGFEVDREDAPLGETVAPPPLSIDDDNSNVSDFVNALPTEVRLVGLAEVNADGGDLRIQRPLELDAGFTLDVPLRVKDRFVLRDTIEEDLSDLDDLTDPEKDVNISTAELQFSYTNGLPLGADVTMIIVDGRGEELETFSDGPNSDSLRLEPAPKENGAASGTASGEFVFTLGDTQQKLRDLADGEEIQLELNMDQSGSGETPAPVARLRADDQLTINQIRLRVKASVQTGN